MTAPTPNAALPYLSAEAAMDLLRRRARVSVHSGALGFEGYIMAEGEVVAYCPAPSLTIRAADGTLSSWSCDLPIQEVGPRPDGGVGGNLTGGEA